MKITLLLPAAAAALTGALAPLGWAPVGWWPLALAAWALLFGLVQRAASAWRAALLGGVFGLGLHLSGHGWIAEALHRHAGLGGVAAALSTGLVAAYLALFIAVPCGLARALCCLDWPSVQARDRREARSGSARHTRASATRPLIAALASALAYASLLTLGEWARSFGFNGYTSLSLGYGLVDSWFAGYLPVGGLYLASWVGLLASAAVALAWDAWPALRGASMVLQRQAPIPLAPIPVVPIPLVPIPLVPIPPAPIPLLPIRPVPTLTVPIVILPMLLLPMLLAAGGWALQRLAWIEPDGPPLSYRLIQSNIEQADKFDPARVQRHVARLVEAIEAAPANLIVTAETAFPLGFNDLPASTLPRLLRYSQSSGRHVFVGVATTAANGSVHNSIVQFAPQSTLARYDKVRLMPFGEYSPAGFGWFTGALAIPLKDLSAGSEKQPPFVVAVRGHRHHVGTLICHEDLIGRDARRRAASSGVLINPSNLAWFDGSIASAQRLQIARVRALEVGRPLLRATNTGITAQIAADGRIAARLPVGHDAVLGGTVQPARGATPYLHAGDALPLAVCLLGLVPAGGARVARRRRLSQPSGETPISKTCAQTMKTP